MFWGKLKRNLKKIEEKIKICPKEKLSTKIDNFHDFFTNNSKEKIKKIKRMSLIKNKKNNITKFNRKFF